jgi:chromate transporter
VNTAISDESKTPAVSLTSLLGVMLKVGATGFGMGMIGVLQQEAVTRRGWVNQEEFADGIALANILPGPIAVNVAVYVGYKLRGWPGALVTLLSLLVPAFCIMLTLTLIYLKFGQNQIFDGARRGINAAVIALVLSVAYRTGKQAIKLQRPGSILQIILLVGTLAVGLIIPRNAYVLAAAVLSCGIIGMFLLAAKPGAANTAGGTKEGQK